MIVVELENPPLESPILSPLTYLSLDLSLDHCPFPDEFFNNIKLPSLETLVLFNATSISPLMAFLERSACSLHTLLLPNWNIGVIHDLMRLLQFLSLSLTKLALSSSPRSRRGVRTISRTRTLGLICVTESCLSILIQIYTSQSEVVGNVFLPHLEIFEYREEPASRLESFKLSNLPPSRNDPKPATSISLRSAYINMASVFHNPIPDNISFILEQLRKDGILNVTYP